MKIGHYTPLDLTAMSLIDVAVQPRSLSQFKFRPRSDNAHDIIAAIQCQLLNSRSLLNLLVLLQAASRHSVPNFLPGFGWKFNDGNPTLPTARYSVFTLQEERVLWTTP